MRSPLNDDILLEEGGVSRKLTITITSRELTASLLKMDIAFQHKWKAWVTPWKVLPEDVQHPMERQLNT